MPGRNLETHTLVETDTLLERADRAIAEARQLVQVNSEWKSRVVEGINRAFVTEITFRQRVGLGPLPPGWAKEPGLPLPSAPGEAASGSDAQP